MTPTKREPRAATRGTQKNCTGFGTSKRQSNAQVELTWDSLVDAEPRLADLAAVARYQRHTSSLLGHTGETGSPETWQAINRELATLVGVDRGRGKGDRIILTRESTMADWDRLVKAAKAEEKASSRAAGDDPALREKGAHALANGHLDKIIRGEVP